ncbi:MAG: hypothetical protein KAI94_05560, partial [Anaerolineales bacterium]|nr:hypothetical protein [Anaerolineales bacterium]
MHERFAHQCGQIANCCPADFLRDVSTESAPENCEAWEDALLCLTQASPGGVEDSPAAAVP